MRLTRRQFVGASSAWLTARAVSARLARADDRSELLNWPAQVFQAPSATPRDRPPVLTCVDIHPRETVFAAAGDDHRVYLWNYEKRELTAAFRGHNDWVRSVVFSPDGQILASAGADRRVICWDATTGEVIHVMSDPRHVVTRLAWSPDGAWIAGVGFEKRLRVYDRATWSLAMHLDCPCTDMRAVTFSPDGKRLAAAGRSGAVRIWGMGQGVMEYEYRAHRQRVHAVAFSPNGEYLVTTGEDRFIHVHGVESDDEGFDLPDSRAKILAFTFYGPHHLATGGSDNYVRLWDLRERREVGHLSGAEGSVAALACRDQVLVATSFDTKARVWVLAHQVAQKT